MTALIAAARKDFTPLIGSFQKRSTNCNCTVSDARNSIVTLGLCESRRDGTLMRCVNRAISRLHDDGALELSAPLGKRVDLIGGARPRPAE